jgi:hypothetical protein
LKTIYFDESGDLGVDFSKTLTSGCFVVTFLMTKDRKKITSIVKRTFGNLRKKDMKKSGGVLHSFREKAGTRFKLLKALLQKDISVAFMKLDKRKFCLAKKPHEIYSDMVASLLDCLYENGILDLSEDVHFIASQMDTNPNHRKKFAHAVTNAARSPNFTFEISRPSDEKGLQAVDFVSWALFRELEFGDPEYADIIREKIVGEYEYR